jgi:DNA-binding phage protein
MGFFAHLDEVVGISKGLTSISNALADLNHDLNRELAGLDSSLGLSTTVTALVNNPLPTLATIGLTMIGVPAPIASAMVTAANGGNMEDVLKSAAIAYIGGEVGKSTGKAFAGSDFATKTLSPELAATLKTVVTSASGSSAVAALQGRPLNEVLAAGLNSAVTTYVTQGLTKQLGLTDPKAISTQLTTSAISAATQAILKGQDVGKAITASVTQTALTVGINAGVNTLIENSATLKNLQTQFNTAKTTASDYFDKTLSKAYDTANAAFTTATTSRAAVQTAASDYETKYNAWEKAKTAAETYVQPTTTTPGYYETVHRRGGEMEVWHPATDTPTGKTKDQVIAEVNAMIPSVNAAATALGEAVIKATTDTQTYESAKGAYLPLETTYKGLIEKATTIGNSIDTLNTATAAVVADVATKTTAYEAETEKQAGVLAKNIGDDAVAKATEYVQAENTVNGLDLPDDYVFPTLDDKVSFSKAYAANRQAFGANATFEWKNPKTGKTETYSTNTAEENAVIAQKRVDLLPAYGTARNTQTGDVIGGPKVSGDKLYINESTGDVYRDTRIFNNRGEVTSGVLQVVNDKKTINDVYTNTDVVIDPMTGAIVSGDGWAAGTSGETFDRINKAAGNAVVTALDVGSGLVKGGANIVGQLGTLGGLTGLVSMDNIATRTANQISTAVDEMRSSDFKDDQQLMYKAIAKAGDAGVFAQMVETAKQFGTNPTQLAEFVVQNGISLLVGSGAATVARALGSGMTVAEAAALGANAVTQGASVAQDTYEQAIKDGESPETALNRARVAGAVGGIVSAAANKFIPGALSNEAKLAEIAVVKESLVKALKGEMASELVEETAGKIAGNVVNGKAWNADLGTTAVQALLGSGLVTSLVHVSTGANDPVASTPTTGLEGITAEQYQNAITSTTKNGNPPTANAVSEFIDAHNVTQDEVRKAFADAGVTDPTPEQIAKYTGEKDEKTTLEVVATNADVVLSLRDAGVPAGKIAGIADQVTQTLTSGKDATEVAHDLLDIFDSNNIDPSKANTMAADYSGLMTTEQITQAINNAIAKNPSATAADIQTAVNTAVKDFATLAQVKSAIADIKFPAGLTAADVTKSIKTYMEANPGLSLADVATKITDATKGLATTTGVQTALTNALKGYATKTDIQDAIKNIQFPAGLTATDVTNSIKTYMEANPGLSLADVATKITDATKGLATTTGVQTALTNALKGVATTQDIKDAIKNIQFPAGLTATDVTNSIKTYMEAHPGLSLADVATKITDATKGLATTTGVQTALTNALKGVATKTDIDNAIAGIKFPAGLTATDVAKEIKTYMEAHPGLNAKDVATEIATYMKDNPPATAADIKTAVTNATKNMATTTDIANLKSNLSDKIDAAIKAGASGDIALQKGIDSLATDLGTTKESILKTLGTTETNLKSDFAVKLSRLETTFSLAISDAIAAGAKGDAALSTAIGNIATDLGTTKDALLKQLGTTESALSRQFTTQISGLDTKLSQAIADAKATGLAGDRALQAAISSVAADQKTDTASLLTQLGTTETNLKKLFSNQLSTLEDKLSNEIDAAVKAGASGDAALQKGIDSLATKMGVNQTALLTEIGKSTTTLKTQFTNQLTSLDTKLSQAIADAQAAGLAGDAALNAAINKVSTDMGTTKADLLTKLGTTEANLKTQFTNQLTSLDTKLSQAIADAQAAGLKGDAALSAAINKVSTDMGTTKADLLTKLGTTEANLKTQFTNQLSTISQDLQAKYDSLSADQKILADQLTQQGVDLSAAITQAQQQTTTQIAGVSQDLQTKFNALTKEQQTLATQLQQQGVDLNTAITQAQQQTTQQIAGVSQDLQTKFNTLTQMDQNLVAQLTRQGVDLNTAINQVQTQSTEQYTNLTNLLTTNQAAIQKQIADDAAAAKVRSDTEAAAAKARSDALAKAGATQAQQTQRNANLNNLMNMLGQAGDVAGQQVTVKGVDPAKIGYVYDWNSIFANPAQQNMFVSPYAKGGMVNGVDEVNDELLNILKG